MKNIKISVIGLGYVGLPLAIEFSKHYNVTGFDIDEERINELYNNFDRTDEVTSQNLKDAKNIIYTSNIDKIKECNVYIITVPTPVDQFKKPDLNILKSATASIGEILKKNDIVIYESTVYPGCTEEVCVPILE